MQQNKAVFKPLEASLIQTDLNTHSYKQRKNIEKKTTQVQNCSFVDSFAKGDCLLQ